jgi:hypothetical protein
VRMPISQIACPFIAKPIIHLIRRPGCLLQQTDIRSLHSHVLDVHKALRSQHNEEGLEMRAFVPNGGSLASMEAQELRYLIYGNGDALEKVAQAQAADQQDSFIIEDDIKYVFDGVKVGN